jgi:hypothetical protein
MAPQVERITHEGLLSQGYFCVDLASQEEFDSARFDEQAKVLGGFPDFADLKFIVIDDKMFIFPEHVRHQDFYNNIKSKLPGTLQCAGLVTIDFHQDSSPTRQIHGQSPSLGNQLPPEVSQWNKFRMIKPALDQFFIFPDL